MLTRVSRNTAVGPFGLLIIAPVLFIVGMLKFYCIVLGIAFEFSVQVYRHLGAHVVSLIKSKKSRNHHAEE